MVLIGFAALAVDLGHALLRRPAGAERGRRRRARAARSTSPAMRRRQPPTRSRSRRQRLHQRRQRRHRARRAADAADAAEGHRAAGRADLVRQGPRIQEHARRAAPPSPTTTRRSRWAARRTRSATSPTARTPALRVTRLHSSGPSVAGKHSPRATVTGSRRRSAATGRGQLPLGWHQHRLQPRRLRVHREQRRRRRNR